MIQHSAFAKSVHIVGLGGSGMGALARLLLGWHFQVSGSDVCDSGQLAALARLHDLIREADKRDGTEEPEGSLWREAPRAPAAPPPRRR